MPWKDIPIDELDQCITPDCELSDDWAQAEPPVSRPLDPGRYNMLIDSVAPRVNDSNQFGIEVVFIVADGDSEGRKLSFQRFSAKPYYQPPPSAPRMTKEERATHPANTSQLYELLRVAGYNQPFSTFAKLPASEQWPLAERLESRQINGIRVDWSGWCKVCSEATLPWASKFPVGADGKREPSAPCPKCGTIIKANAGIPFGGLPQLKETPNV